MRETDRGEKNKADAEGKGAETEGKGAEIEGMALKLREGQREAETRIPSTAAVKLTPRRSSAS